MSLNIVKSHCTAFKRYGQNRSGTFDSIEIHSIGCAQNTASAIRDNMNQYSPDGIVHAIVDAEISGKVLEILPDNNVAWADGGYGNSHSFTIEMSESDYMKYTGGANYTITNNEKFLADINRVYATCVEYVAYKCKQFGFDPMKKLSNGLYQVYSHQEANQKGLATAHVDPSHLLPKIGKSMDTFRADVKSIMYGGTISIASSDTYFVGTAWENGKCENQHNSFSVYANATKDADTAKSKNKKTYYVFDAKGNVKYTAEYVAGKGTTYKDFDGLTDAQCAEKILEIAKPIALKYGRFPSVLAAQCILESGYCRTTKLVKEGNNCAGMKCDLINSQWTGSTWDGVSKIQIYTPEDYGNGIVYIYDWFRKYECIEDCMADKSAFFSSLPKYVNAGVLKAKNYTEEITIIKANGYATDQSYVSKVCNIIKQYGLDKYDNEKTDSASVASQKTTITSSDTYFVGTAWKDGKCVNQHNSFSVYANATKDADNAAKSANKTYYVFDSKGAVKYTAKVSTGSQSTAETFKEYMVKVSIPNLNIRKSPNGEKLGKYTGVGKFTIVEEQKAGDYTWGLLKSYQKNRNGWIALSYTTKI